MAASLPLRAVRRELRVEAPRCPVSGHCPAPHSQHWTTAARVSREEKRVGTARASVRCE